MRLRCCVPSVTWLATLSLACVLLGAGNGSFGQESKPTDKAAKGPAVMAPQQSTSSERSPSKDAPVSSAPGSETAEPATTPTQKAPAAKEQSAAERQSKAEPAKPAAPAEPPALPPLGKEMTALRDQVRHALVRCYQLPIDTRTNTAWDVMEFCLAFGVDAQVRDGNRQVNGLGSLCWNFSFGGYQLLIADSSAIMARVGYGFQGYPGQFLAVLGQSGVPANYELRIGQRRGTVADLVEYEKRNCRSGAVQAHKLIGLAFYVKTDQSWKNDLDESWSLERLLDTELDRTVAPEGSAATDRLMGLTCAVDRRQRSKLPIEGEYARAQRFLEKFTGYALSAQNPDGSWHPSFFALRGSSQDGVGMLYSTGHILEWLAYWLEDEKLTDPQIVRSVAYLAAALEAQFTRWGVASTAPLDMSAVAHAAHALMIYDHRVFQPYDAQKPGPEAQKAEQKEKK